ncbi:MAG: RdgB/HAM1 family non-canonical purine NTP pyrophosphatase [Gammaproteobacteria bacterium]
MAGETENGDALRVVLASGNAGKLKELGEILQLSNVELVPQSAFDVSEVAETGLSFVENALIKARHACRETGLPAIADDSGIEVDALNGEPGIYSARYAGVSGDRADAANNEKLLSELEQVAEEDRTARFQCVIVYLKHEKDPMPLICQGTWEGRILFEEAGENGFGYDPLFYVPTHDCASAELPADVKNSLSHRGQALRQFQACWKAHS